MKEIFLALRAQLKTIPELKWIDLNKGQMNYEKPAVAFPAVLININLPRTENITKTLQDCNGSITVRVCFDFTGRTNHLLNDAQIAKSLAYFNLINKVHAKLQGFENDHFNSLKRTSALEDERPDGYKVMPINYRTSFREDLVTEEV